MSAQALQEALFKEMDKLRKGSKRIGALEIAELAHRVGGRSGYLDSLCCDSEGSPELV